MSEILASPYYKEWTGYFEKVLRATRNKKYRSNRKELLAMQLKLAEVETIFWKMLRKGRGCAKKLQQIKSKRELTVKEIADLKNYENHIFINEQLIRISRTICDGIAWRNLRYSRTFLSSAARGFGAGDVDIESESFKGEFDWAYKISEAFDSVVLLNDLTRFLRVGDLTEINPEGTFIHEIKKNGKEIKNMFTLRKLKKNKKLSDQDKRLLELQRIALTDEALVRGTGVRTEKLNTELKTNFRKLRKLLKKSEKELVVSEQIEPCITLHITNFDAISLAGDSVNLEVLKSRLSFPSAKGVVMPHSSWDMFYSDEKGNFLRSSVPYSVFPLSAKHCTKLISGYYLVDCILDVEKLKEILQSHNWVVEMVTEEELDKQLNAYESVKNTIFSVKKPLYSSTPDEIGLLRIKRGAFSFNLTPSFYNRMTTEFMSLETLLSILEEMYSRAAKKQRSNFYFPVLSGESEAWN